MFDRFPFYDCGPSSPGAADNRFPVGAAQGAMRVVSSFAETDGVKFGKIAQPMRVALTGDTASPGIFEVMVALGRDEVLGRLSDL